MSAKATEKPEQFFPLTKAQESAYWAVVLDCLVEFFGLTRIVALAKVRASRGKLDDISAKEGSNLYYHQEPLYMAAMIAVQDVNETEELGAQYDKILEKHGRLRLA